MVRTTTTGSGDHMNRIASTAACAVLPWALAAAPAQAASERFTDHDGGAETAITSVRVHNGDARLSVYLRHRETMHLDRVWLDTRPNDPGPEYRVSVLANSDYDDPLIEVESFDTNRGPSQRCPGIALHSDVYDNEPVSYVKIPQSCLAGPGKVRVAADSSGPDDAYDIAPNRGDYSDSRFTPWIAIG